MILSNMKCWIGNFYPKTYADALLAWGEMAKLGFPPADSADILHEVKLVGGGRLMAIRCAGGEKVIAVLSMT